MNVDRVVIEGDGTKKEFEEWKKRTNTSDSPIGKLPGVRLIDVIPHGPESQPQFPFELVYEK